MKVECPNCQTKYNLPDDRVGPDGANVRCSQCKHVFRVEAPVKDDFPGFGDTGDEPGWPSSDDDSGGAGDFAGHMEAESRQDRFDIGSVASSDFSSIDFGKPEKKESRLPTRTVILAAVLGFLVLAGIGATAAYFFEFWPFVKKPATSAMEGAAPKPGEEKPAAAKPGENKPAAPDYTVALAFETYNYYNVDNEKVGKLSVIDGKLVNKSPVTVGHISVEATLLDTKKAPVVSQVVEIGPKATIFELKTLNKEDLTSRLKSTQEIMLNNSAVKPGDEVPFMIVFPNVPNTVDSYTLSVKNYFEVQQPAGEQSGQPAAQPAAPAAAKKE